MLPTIGMVRDEMEQVVFSDLSEEEKNLKLAITFGKFIQANDKNKTKAFDAWNVAMSETISAYEGTRH